MLSKDFGKEQFKNVYFVTGCATGEKSTVNETLKVVEKHFGLSV